MSWDHWLWLHNLLASASYPEDDLLQEKQDEDLLMKVLWSQDLAVEGFLVHLVCTSSSRLLSVAVMIYTSSCRQRAILARHRKISQSESALYVALT